MAENDIKTCKLQVTADAVTDGRICEISKLGFLGNNKSEVAYFILRTWLWDNQEMLRRNGVKIALSDKKDD